MNVWRSACGVWRLAFGDQLPEPVEPSGGEPVEPSGGERKGGKMGTVKYIVHYQDSTGGQSTIVMETENNSMSTTNLVYAFYKLYPQCTIISIKVVVKNN